MTKNGSNQKFQTVILSKNRIDELLSILSKTKWVQNEINYYSGNLLACRVIKNDEISINVINVYSPAWPVNKSKYQNENISDIKLTQNKDIWVADILWTSLREMFSLNNEYWIIAGDFNLSETFDAWKDGPRGNREYLDRMKNIGLVECLRLKQGKLIPTYLNKDKKTHIHQMDHLFVTNMLANKLIECNVGERGIVFGHTAQKLTHPTLKK